MKNLIIGVCFVGLVSQGAQAEDAPSNSIVRPQPVFSCQAKGIDPTHDTGVDQLIIAKEGFASTEYTVLLLSEGKVVRMIPAASVDASTEPSSADFPNLVLLERRSSAAKILGSTFFRDGITSMGLLVPTEYGIKEGLQELALTGCEHLAEPQQ